MRPPNRSLSWLVLCALFLLAIPAVQAHASSSDPNPSVIVVDFSVPVDPGSSALMSTAVAMAQADGSSAIVIQMNTPGGLLSDMTEIIASIQQANASGIPTYTYVPPDGLAASAGSYIAMASNKILMGTGSEIGPSTPIVVGGTDLEQNHTEDAMIDLMVSLAQEWGRNTTAAYDMVYSDTAYTSGQAQSIHLIDGNASSLQNALSELGLNGSYVVVQESTYDQLLSALSDTTVDGILILLGAVAIVIDFLHPTVVLSVTGAIAIIAGLVGAEVVGASVLGLAVIAAGVGLMLLELRLGHGLAMMGGMVVGAIGIYLLLGGVQYSPSPLNGATEVELVAVAGVGVVAGLYIRWAVGPLRQRRRTGPEALIGKSGRVTTPLSPTGEVDVDGILWRARGLSGDLAQGEVVTVKSLEGLMLVVEKTESGPAAVTLGSQPAPRPEG